VTGVRGKKIEEIRKRWGKEMWRKEGGKSAGLVFEMGGNGFRGRRATVPQPISGTLGNAGRNEGRTGCSLWCNAWV
jgi:hypothetical protein